MTQEQRCYQPVRPRNRILRPIGVMTTHVGHCDTQLTYIGYVCPHTQPQGCAQAHTHQYKCTCAPLSHTHTDIYTLTHTHNYTHTHTHTHPLPIYTSSNISESGFTLFISKSQLFHTTGCFIGLLQTVSVCYWTFVCCEIAWGMFWTKPALGLLWQVWTDPHTHSHTHTHTSAQHKHICLNQFIWFWCILSVMWLFGVVFHSTEHLQAGNLSSLRAQTLHDLGNLHYYKGSRRYLLFFLLKSHLNTQELTVTCLVT